MMMHPRHGPPALRLIGSLIAIMVLSPDVRAGWTFVPLTGYSSTTGFAYGAMVAGQDVAGLDAIGLEAYRTTRGREVLELEMMKVGPGGMTILDLEHKRTPTARFFGYGNGGDEEEYAEYSEERDRLTLEHQLRLMGGLMGGLGLDLRHSVVYDRQQSELWETFPGGGNYSSAWSAGPLASLTLHNPVGAGFPGYVSCEASWQLSDHGSFGNLTARLAEFAPIGRGATVLGGHVAASRQLGLEDTRFTWRPTLGGGDDLRGYRDWRFTGRWMLWANLEVRQRVLTVSGEPGAYLSSVGLVLFGDAGQVRDRLGGMRWERFHLCAGIGLRIMMSDNVVVRADFSRSPEGNGIILTFGELF